MDEVINYVMETPGNTNPNVLKGMLENYVEPSGTIEITENGTVDVAEYASAEVNISSTVQNYGEITIVNNTGVSFKAIFYSVSDSDDGIILKPVNIANGSTETVKVLLAKYTFTSPPRDPVLAIPEDMVY